MFVRFSQYKVTSTAIIGIQNPFYFKPNKVSIEREVVSSFGVFNKNNKIGKLLKKLYSYF